MVEITAGMVRALRQETGAGIMECKRALLESDGDSERAIDALRRSGLLSANQKSGRITAEGLVRLLPFNQGTAFVMLEVDCETDFVAKQQHFTEFVDQVAQAIADSDVDDLDESQLAGLSLGDATVAAQRTALIAQLGENIQIRRFQRIHTIGDNRGCYVHGTRIATVVDLQGGSPELAKDLAMHVAASRPLCLDADDLDADVLARERGIYMEQAQQSAKPPAIIEKIVAGKINKFLNAVSLLKQPFVKDSDYSVAQWLAQQQAQVHAFYRYEVGEGIEKKKENFATEVMAQVKSA